MHRAGDDRRRSGTCQSLNQRTIIFAPLEFKRLSSRPYQHYINNRARLLAVIRKSFVSPSALGGWPTLYCPTYQLACDAGLIHKKISYQFFPIDEMGGKIE